MNKHLRTSVVIPAYNESVYLERCLEALQSQTAPVHEIIVVDNNSSDDSVMQAKKRFPGATFLFEKQQGIVFARNKGFHYASGDVIAKLDADSIVDGNWNEELLRDINSSKADAWSGYVYCHEIHPRLRRATDLMFKPSPLELRE